MQLPIIRQLADTATVEQLRAAEEALMNGDPLPIEVGGEDEGEQLTHILAAIFILEEVASGKTKQEALRAYSQRVRKSIS